MYQLFCDSNCELWHTTVKELGLNLIRMPYIVDGEEYFYDMGENTDFKKFFDGMKAGGTPTTAALNEYAYTEYFEPVLARGEDIYYITFSHQMSGTFNAMKNVIERLKEKYPDINIVAIDYDAGATAVNQENRIRLMLSNARLVPAENEIHSPKKADSDLINV